jgi:ABC-2 type transport system ATP-binding protein
VSFRAEPGEIFGLLGPNGAGKPSTLECVLGLRRPDSGKITLGEIDLIHQSTSAKALIGAALQSAQLQDKITPREALRLFSSFYPQARTPEALLKEFQLTEKADASFASLSGGQKQRLFLALAFIHNPQLVVLDEPTVGLDPNARRELHVAIRRARATGCAIVLSTHDLAEAEQLCDRLAIIDHGRIVASNTYSQLIASSRARPRVCVRARTRDGTAIDETGWDQIDSAASVSQRGDEIVIATDQVNRTTIAMVQRLQERGDELLDLRVQRPSLEDVFFEVTGRVYSETGDAVELGSEQAQARMGSAKGNAGANAQEKAMAKKKENNA